MISNILVILAAGMGIRYGTEVPKQFTLLLGKEVLRIVLETMIPSEFTDRIIVVLDNEERMKLVKTEYDVDVILGGKDRAHSFQNALSYINNSYKDATKVIFHEAARPLVSSEVIDTYFTLLNQYDYVETCQEITDSLGSYILESPKREDFYLIQAPEAYRINILNKFFDCDSSIYFAANQFPKECKGYRYFNVPNNIKLTKPEDKYLIEFLLKQQSNDI
ncbi:MAG: 2-C-methyl-D-erythritol 4-phosphate cytidylyltransferase [Lachnospiraceae bacterium]|nr:2-C-methyl-D-erythritol 4-phosphate cytidylyltransferase [Lachnospiraceae bacterium]